MRAVLGHPALLQINEKLGASNVSDQDAVVDVPERTNTPPPHTPRYMKSPRSAAFLKTFITAVFLLFFQIEIFSSSLSNVQVCKRICKSSGSKQHGRAMAEV
jgi:hypothetical protein